MGTNVELYWENLEKLLEQNLSLWENPENLQVLASTIPQAFIQAAELAVPQKSSKPPNFKVNKSVEWRKAEISANKAAKTWRDNGKPRDLENKFVCEKKEARSKIRDAVQKHNAAENVKENNEMMNANFRDPKLFSKLVQKKRVNNQGYTTMLSFDGKDYYGFVSLF